MTTERIYEFIALSQTLNFNKAAQQLFMTQSVLSRHIKELEDEVGFKLFIRNTRNVALTEAGKRLAEDMSRLMTDCDNVVNRLRVGDKKTSGNLSIGCTDSCMHAPFLDFLRTFIAKHPDIDVQTYATQGPIPIGRWMLDDFFFSPCIYPNIPKHFEYIHTFAQGAKLIFSKDHPLCGTEKISLSQLAGQTLLIPYSEEPFGPFAKNKQLAEKYSSGGVKVIACKNKSTAIFHAELGMGLTIMPASLVYKDNANFCSCEITDKECNFDLYMYTNTSRQDYAVRVFMEEVLSACGEETDKLSREVK